MNRAKLFIIFCLLWLCPFIITSFFNQPAIDDYWNANAVIQYGSRGAVNFFCHTVSSRYCSLFIMSFCNTLPGGEVWIFKVWPIFILVFLFSSLCFFYASIFDATVSSAKIICLALLFVVLHVAGMRSLFEGLYWMSATVCYQLATGMFAIAAGALVWNLKSPGWLAKSMAFAASCLLPGTVEIVIPVYILLLAGLLYVATKRKLDKTLPACCLAVVLLISFFILHNGPNLARIEDNHSFYNPSLVQALYDSVRSTGYYLVLWIINPLTIVMVLLLSTGGFSLPKELRVSFTAGRYLLFLISIPVIGLILYLPLHLFESSIPFPRITSLFFFFFFQLFIVLQFAMFANHPASLFLSKYLAEIRYVKLLLPGLFFLCAITSRNFLAVSEDLLTGRATQYNTESLYRYNLIRQCTKDTCYVPRHTVWPTFAQMSPEEPADSAYYFRHMNQYFKKTIQLRR